MSIDTQSAWERENFQLRELLKKEETENIGLKKQVADLEAKNKEQAHSILKLQRELDGLQKVI